MRHLMPVVELGVCLGIGLARLKEVLVDGDVQLVFDGCAHYVDAEAALRALGAKLATARAIASEAAEGDRGELLTVDEAAKRLAISVSQLYRLIARNDVATVMIGRSRRVPVVSLREFIARRAAM